MNIVSALSEAHIAQLHALYQGEWWSRGRSLEDTRKVVQGSQLCIGITAEDGELLGFARVLTDFTFKAFIFDLIVASNARGQGLGDQLVALILHHEALQSIRHFELYCLPEMQAFYARHGFSAELGPLTLLRAERV